jgi:excisionase family DNA binding protein
MMRRPVTVAEAAALLRVSDGYIESLLADGYLHLAPGRRADRLIDAGEVEAYAERRAEWQRGSRGTTR